MAVQKQNQFNPKTFSDWSVTLITGAGKELDISGITEQLSIFESIYNNCMFGTIMIKDLVGFEERNEIIGQNEKIKIEIETPTLPDGQRTSNLEKTFIVNGYGNAMHSTDGKGITTAQISFVSPFLIRNNKTRINRSFAEMTSHEIVKYIAQDILLIGIDVDNDWANLQVNTASKHVKPIVVPGWNPLRTINFLCENTISVDGYSDYLFFENNSGFNFTTVEDLKKQQVMRIVSLSGLPAETQGSQINQKTGQGVSQGHIIEDFTHKSRFEHAGALLNGLYGGNITTHNILAKELKHYEIEYDGDWEPTLGFSGLNGGGEFEVSSTGNRGYYSDDYIYDIHDKSEMSHYAYRDMKEAERKQVTVQFNMAGDSNIWAGDVIQINLPTFIKDNDKTKHHMMSGEWLITEIHHKINNQEYIMTCEAMKDGFEDLPGSV